TPSAETPVPESGSAPPTVDDATLKALESKSEGSLTTAETLTLFEGHREREIAAVAAFRGKLARDPRSIADKAGAPEFRGFLTNRDTAGDALAAVAALPGSVGPDIVYEVWTGTTERTDVTELARQLAYSKEMRAGATHALSVALDLRAATTCEQAR